MMDQFIHIKSAKFPIMAGEAEELVNEQTYGKALALYLQGKLAEKGYETGHVGCEDWGWWVDASKAGFLSGVRVYSAPCSEGQSPTVFCCANGSHAPKKWNWSKFRFDDLTPMIRQLDADLLDIFGQDPDIVVVGVVDEFPLDERDVA